MVISEEELSNGLSYSYVENKTNELFNLVYIFDMGSDNDKDLALAIKYLPYMGTGDFTAEEVVSAKSTGAIGVNLGPARLRAETAAMVACAHLNVMK